MNDRSLSRREALLAGAASMTVAATASAEVSTASPLKGRLKQSVCKWCYSKTPLDELCQKSKEMGIVSIDLLSEADWDVPKKYGLASTMPMGLTGISDGWNNPTRHDKHVQDAERLLPIIREKGMNNVIVFSGNRDPGLTDQQGIKNCALGLKRIMPLAEKLGITVCMELLNSKRDHKGYMCDHTAWGVDLCKEVGSANFKLLYDIYHMQIMEGDVIDTLQRNKDYIGHYHTGGVPGRAEIDTTQELHYPAIAKAIIDTGYTGHFAHEFIPKRDPMTSLNDAVKLCDV
jgi:hydroxypyruvate isomerase